MRYKNPTRDLEQIKDSGKLIVLTRNAPTSLYTDRDGIERGVEHDLALSFAESIGVEVEFKIKSSVKDIISAIENAEGDLAASGLTITEKRKELFLFSNGYQDVTQQVVCRRDSQQPDNVEDLVGLNLVVIANSSYVERLEELKEQVPGLEWTESSTDTTEQLLYKVWKREIDCTIADSNIVDINRRYYPELLAPLNIKESESLGWMMSEDRDDLKDAVDDWLADYKEAGELASLIDRYYGFFEEFDYVDTRKFITRIRKRFPKYQTWFKQAAEKYDLHYLLLSSQAYQESHWRADARSPTGVRGIMMLTLDTAKAMGVKSRLDAKQSIFGGAKYMSSLIKKRFVDEVTEPDRTWLALAAYNVGRGHLHDAQKLAREKNLNPYLWRDVKQVLPLLSEKKYYSKLRYGYARGTEPVRYVQRIREYYLILNNEIEPTPH